VSLCMRQLSRLTDETFAVQEFQLRSSAASSY
jgi:hypothetical protein